MKRIWIDIDTGDTLTDLVLAQLTAGTYHDHQLPTTTNPAQARRVAEYRSSAHLWNGLSTVWGIRGTTMVGTP